MKNKILFPFINIIFAFALVFGAGSSLVSSKLVSAAQDEEANQTSSGSHLFLPVIGRAPVVVPVTPPIGIYDKFEFQFDITTTAQNPSLPFDPNPPPGIQPGIGVNVDVLFTYDNWQNTIVQPAFLNHEYDHSVRNSKDHFVPTGRPRWTVRFTPQRAGNWQYRVRVEDSDGIRYYPGQNSPAYSLTVENKPTALMPVMVF
jgi:hypothetical protein